MIAKKNIDYAKRLRSLREALKFSQREMAKEFLVTPGAIAHWESGNRSVPGPVIKLIEIYESASKTDKRKR